MIKIGIGGIALTMLSACGNGTPDYDATGTFEATEVIVSAEAAGTKVTCSQKNAIDEYPDLLYNIK